MTDTTGTDLSTRFEPTIASQVVVSFGQQRDLYLLPQEDVILLRPNASTQFDKEFKKHEKKWKRETQYFSSPGDKYLHPSYARIIGMGYPAVSLILKSMQRQPADWFYALRAMTGANPVSSAMAGDLRKMTEAWIKWGERQGLLR
jgi:hypothetical protein